MLIAAVTLCAFLMYLAGIYFYSRRVSGAFGLDPANITPAVELQDGVDFVPSKKGYLLSQHFASISAAGPIAGPILACMYFGWGPSLIWIIAGAVFIGAVHDFSSLVTSVKNKARSIAEIVRITLGKKAYLAFMAFIWISLEYVIIAFTDITADGFVSGGEGPVIASSSAMYLLIGVSMGFLLNYFRVPLWLATLIFVPLTFSTVYLGRFIPLDLRGIGFIEPRILWGLIILAYCFLASVLPMWLLMQPRGHLGGFFLYVTLIGGLLGAVFGGFEIMQPFAGGFVYSDKKTDFSMPLFPFLFVTIACGACSGFHSLVCSGTTSKQVSNEKDTVLIGYGGMILESVMALLALLAVMTVAESDIYARKLSPSIIYGEGIGRFLAVLGIPAALGVTFGAMAFTTFVYDTLDVATRLGRYILQEIMGHEPSKGKYTATVVTCALPAIVLFFSAKGVYKHFWTLFGASNQLLAALVLLVVTCWLYSTGRRFYFTFVPMVIMFAVTITSLAFICLHALKARNTIDIINGCIAMVLMALSALILTESLKFVRRTA